MNLRLIVENFMKVSRRLYSESPQGLMIFLVWRPHLYQMS